MNNQLQECQNHLQPDLIDTQLKQGHTEWFVLPQMQQPPYQNATLVHYKVAQEGGSSGGLIFYGTGWISQCWLHYLHHN